MIQESKNVGLHVEINDRLLLFDNLFKVIKFNEIFSTYLLIKIRFS